MIKCMIVDDEPLAQRVLEKHILRVPELVLAKKCANALEAFDLLSRERTDLMFLDIHMPALSGIDFIRSLKTPPAFIFTTAFSEYAVESYELEAIDYLMKPVTFDRFSMAIAKFRKTRPEPPTPCSYSYFKIDGQLVKIGHSDIFYAQSIRDYIILGTPQGHRIVHLTMKGLEEILPASMFVRIHRSFMIGISHVTMLAKDRVALGAMQIPVGGHYKKTLDLLKTRILLPQL
jgi:DNA-binding LytR/AlgR family response regulator